MKGNAIWYLIAFNWCVSSSVFISITQIHSTFSIKIHRRLVLWLFHVLHSPYSNVKLPKSKPEFDGQTAGRTDIVACSSCAQLKMLTSYSTTKWHVCHCFIWEVSTTTCRRRKDCREAIWPQSQTVAQHCMCVNHHMIIWSSQMQPITHTVRP